MEWMCWKGVWNLVGDILERRRKRRTHKNKNSQFVCQVKPQLINTTWALPSLICYLWKVIVSWGWSISLLNFQLPKVVLIHLLATTKCIKSIKKLFPPILPVHLIWRHFLKPVMSVTPLSLQAKKTVTTLAPSLKAGCTGIQKMFKTNVSILSVVCVLFMT